MRSLLAGIALCLAVGCARTPRQDLTDVRFAAWTGEGFNGRRLSTDHFEIISTVSDAEFERGLPDFLETAYNAYESTLPVGGSIEHPLTTYVFGLRDEWARFMHVRFPLRSEVYARIRSGGFTEGTTSVSFYVDRGVTLATLAHEGWHQYVNARLDRPIPAWINEGVACAFESFDLVHDQPRFTPRRNAFRVNSLREAIQRDTLMSLSEIVDTDAGEVILSDRTRKTDTYYAQAWALISFLRYGAGRRYAPAFDRMLRDIGNGVFSARVSAAKVTGRRESESSDTAISADDAGNAPISDGRAAFLAYFDTKPNALQDDYYDYLIRTAGF